MCAASRLVDLPHLSGPQHPELLRRDPGRRYRLGERARGRVDRVVCQGEGAMVMRERELGSAVAERLHRLGGIHVLITHEPARLIGADRQDRQPERAVPFPRVAEVASFSIA
jgi:hypothetical protein